MEDRKVVASVASDIRDVKKAPEWPQHVGQGPAAKHQHVKYHVVMIFRGGAGAMRSEVRPLPPCKLPRSPAVKQMDKEIGPSTKSQWL